MPPEGPTLGSDAPFQIVTDTVDPFVHVQYPSLDETELATGDWAYFANGRSLASMHRVNILHGNWQPDSVAFDIATGAAMPLDLSSVNVCEIDPAVRAADFKAPHANMSPTAFQALLAGYVRGCWHSIEAHQPGYVDGLLAALGVVVDRIERPRDTLADTKVVMTNLGLEIELGEQGVSLSTLDEPSPMTFFDERPEDCMVLLVGLTCAGFDVRELTRQENLLRAKTDTGQRLGKLIDMLRAYDPVGKDPTIASHEEAVLVSLFACLQKTMGYPADLDFLTGNGPIQVVGQILSTMETSVRLRVCRGIVDVADYAAAEAAKLEIKQGVDHRFSQAVAQRALLALLMAGQINAADHSDMLTMLHRHGPAGWRPPSPSVKGLIDKPINELDALEMIPLLGALTYQQSKGSLFKQEFENSLQGVEDANPRWSCAWDALAIYRPMMPTLLSRADHWNTRRKFGRQLDALSRMTSGSYAVTLMRYADRVRALVDRYQQGASVVLPGNVIEKWEQLMAELQAATAFCEFIKDGSLKKKRGRELLGAMVGG